MRICSFVVVAAAVALMAQGAAAGTTANTLAPEPFAGYTLTDPSDSSLHVTATFVVPKLSCGSAARAISPELGMEADTEWSSAGLFVGCYGGAAHYWPTLVVNGIRTNYKTGSTAHSGDTIVLTASENATKASVSVVDKTRKFTRRETGAGATSVGYPWIGDNNWLNGHGQREGVPNFGTLRFTHGLVNGMPFGSWPGGKDRTNMQTASVVQIKTGPFASSQEAFSTHFVHS